MLDLKWWKQRWQRLYCRIVREKATCEYVARGWAIGIFYGCFIPFGLQLICSLPTAFLLKGSKVGATLGTFITNHFTIFIIYPVQCWVGNRVIGGDLSYQEVVTIMKKVVNEQSYSSLLSLGGELAASFFIGGALLAAVTTPLTYWGVKKLVYSYQNRKFSKNQFKK